MTFIMKIMNQTFCMAFQTMMVHHQAMFGYKIFGGSEDAVQTFSDILNLCCDLDVEHSNPTFSQDTLAYDHVPSNQVWLQKDKQFRYIKETVRFDCMIISPYCHLDPEHRKPELLLFFPHYI